MRMRLPILFVACLLLAADAPQKGPAKLEKKLWAAISVNKPVWVPGRGTEPFMLFYSVVNDGDKVVDPEISATQLLVNGKELADWDITVANGPRDARWTALPPGDCIQAGAALGSHFKKPGIYKVSWKGKGFQSPEIVFRVLPEDKK